MRKRFKALFDPNQSVLLSVIGTATLTIALQALYDTAKQTARDQAFPELLGAWILAIVMIMVSLAVIILPLLRRPRTIGVVNISEDRVSKLHAGLILLVSPQRGTAPDAIKFHGAALKVCWLIASKDSFGTAKKLAEEFRAEFPHAKFIVPDEQHLVDPDQVGDTYRRVIDVCTIAREKYSLTTRDLIADITGGLKPMTAGMSSACLAAGIDLQYMKAFREKDGEANRSKPTIPIRIDQEFVPL